MGPYWLAYEHIFHIIAIIAFSFEGRTLALLLTFKAPDIAIGIGIGKAPEKILTFYIAIKNPS